MSSRRWLLMVVMSALFAASASAQAPDPDADGVPGGEIESEGYSITGGAVGTILAISFHIIDAPIWSVDSVSGDAEVVGSTGIARAGSLTRDATGRLYSAGTFVISTPAVATDKLFTIDPVTLETTVLGTLDFGGDPPSIRALALSPAGVLYASQNTPPVGGTGPYELWTIDIDTLTGTRIGGMTARPQALTFSPEGVLYGMGPSEGLFVVDPATGESEYVGDSFGGFNIQTIFFDENGELYGAGGGLYRIDTETGSVVTIVSGGPSFYGAEFNLAADCSIAADCDDGLFCNGPESCENGTCAAGSPPCPQQFCDEIDDACETSAVPLVSEIGIAVMAVILVGLGAYLFGRLRLGG